jgi:hypothetical protein
MTTEEEKALSQFLAGKSEYTLTLFNTFLSRYKAIGNISVEPTKTMIGISNNHKRIAWVTQLGRNFIHVVFPFKQEYHDNLCFKKVGQVPGQNQYNHHFRMMAVEDLNEEVISFMQKAYHEEK